MESRMPTAGLAFNSVTDDSGASATDRITSDNTLTLSGTFTRTAGRLPTLRVRVVGADNGPVPVTTVRKDQGETQLPAEIRARIAEAAAVLRGAVRDAA
jgi:hypothetical protein